MLGSALWLNVCVSALSALLISAAMAYFALRIPLSPLRQSLSAIVSMLSAVCAGWIAVVVVALWPSLSSGMIVVIGLLVWLAIFGLNITWQKIFA